MVFSMLALLCGLAELGLNHNTWIDIVVGWAMGAAMAWYLVIISIYQNRFYMSLALFLAYLLLYIEIQLTDKMTGRSGEFCILVHGMHLVSRLCFKCKYVIVYILHDYVNVNL